MGDRTRTNVCEAVSAAGLLALLFAAGPAEARSVSHVAPPSTVERYEHIQVTLNVTGPVASNPFTEVSVSGQFTPSGGGTITVGGFCDSTDGTVFRVRFTPSEAKAYTYGISYTDGAGTETFTGSFTAAEAGRKGFIRVDPSYPYHFKFENGGRPFICSKTAWLIVDTSTWQGFVDKMLPRGENCIRFGVECNYYFPTIAKDVWPWGGTRASPDYTRFNPAVWQKMESIISHCLDNDVYCELVAFTSLGGIYVDGNFPYADGEPYWDYMIARLSGFANVIAWQLVNEKSAGKTHQKYMADYLHASDPYGHPVCTSAGTTTDALFASETWINLAINHSCTDDSQLESRYHTIARTIHTYDKPGWCDETGRENRHGNDDGVHRRKQYWTWNICGDYWSYHSWEGCEGIEDLAYNGPGSEFLQYIRPFWENTEWWRMQPDDTLIKNNPASQYEWCLASSNEYVVYMVNETTAAATAAGTLQLQLAAGTYAAEFYNPSDGTYFDTHKTTGIAGGTIVTLDHPAFTDDLVVHVHLDDATPPSKPTGLTATPVTESRIDLSWTTSTDPESNIRHYNVYRAGANIATPTGTSYADTGLTEDTSYTYEVSAVNGAGLEGPKSDPATGQTLADTTAPAIASVEATVTTTVEVLFSEAVAEASAADETNYTITNGVTVLAASLGADLRTVTLTTSTLPEGVTCTLTVLTITDRASTPNTATNLQATFAYMPAPVTVDLAPEADTYVDERYPDSNLGGDAEVAVGGPTATRKIFIRFNVDIPAGAAVTQANLVLVATNASVESGGVVRLFAPTVEQWDEMTPTWSNRLGLGNDASGDLASLGPIVVGNTYGFTGLEAAATQAGRYTFVIRSGAADGAAYHSKEHTTASERPVLRLTYQPGAVDPTDTDGDGMKDDWELQYFGDLSHDGTADGDADGLTDLQEFQHSTDPTDADTDDDGVSDGDEVAAGTDPTRAPSPEKKGCATGPSGAPGTALPLLAAVLLACASRRRSVSRAEQPRR